MTPREFQHKYHEYMTWNWNEANAEAMKVNGEGIDGDIAVVVNFPGLGYCLMLKTALAVVKQLEIIQGT